MFICSCYDGVRGKHCNHRLALEMLSGVREKPSEEQKLTSRRKRGRAAKNNKINVFWFMCKIVNQWINMNKIICNMQIWILFKYAPKWFFAILIILWFFVCAPFFLCFLHLLLNLMLCKFLELLRFGTIFWCKNAIILQIYMSQKF